MPLHLPTIDSAPKDGTEILIVCDWEPLAVVGYWGLPYRQGDDDSKRETWRVKWDGSALDEGYEATHWAPLPKFK